MLSMIHTVTCPSCGRSATIRVHAPRASRTTSGHVVAPHVGFSCKRGCVPDAEEIRALSGIDLAV